MSVAAPNPTGSPETRAPLNRRIVLLLATTAGVSVANIYFAQPLVYLIADGFGVQATTAGLLVAAAQFGYAVGLALLVPLGDLVERRSLITRVLVLTGLVALLCAGSPSFPVLGAAIIALGGLAVVAQIAVPLASSLAAPQERGAVVGTVMSGLLVGILMARTLSGLIASVGGWRLVFIVAAAAMLALSAVLRRVLPEAPATDDSTYPQALRSVFTLIHEEPLLRQRMAMGACNMAAFSTLWAGVVLLLGGPHFGYSEGVVGLFGLAGLAGVLAAPYAGKLADRGQGALATTAFLLALLVAWPVLALGQGAVVVLIAGIILFDLGAQGAQISNQSAIYALRPEARSRLTTAYVTAFFLGGVAGSALASVVYHAEGWHATCLLGAAFSATSLLIWATAQRARAGSDTGGSAPPAAVGGGLSGR